MRRMDCDQMRPQVGEIVVGGKIFKIMRRTIGQELLHDDELKKARKALKKLSKGDGETISEEYSQTYNAWLRREIQIFIPEFGEKEFKLISHDQRDQILAMIFERDIEDFKKEEGKPAKKNKKGGQHGEKS